MCKSENNKKMDWTQKKKNKKTKKNKKNHWHPGIRNFFDLNIRLAYNDLIKYLTSKFLNILVLI